MPKSQIGDTQSGEIQTTSDWQGFESMAFLFEQFTSLDVADLKSARGRNFHHILWHFHCRYTTYPTVNGTVNGVSGPLAKAVYSTSKLAGSDKFYFQLLKEGSSRKNGKPYLQRSF